MPSLDSPDELLAHLALIVARAYTLRERLATKTGAGASTQDARLLTDRLARWQEFGARHDPEQFARRLASDDLTREALSGILGNTQQGNHQLSGESLPGWAYLLAEVIDAQREKMGPAACVAPDEPIPFEEILLPFVIVARRKLDQWMGGPSP